MRATASLHHGSVATGGIARRTNPFVPPSPVRIPIQGKHKDCEFFYVRRVFCVGQNYAKHAREMGATSAVEPFFFTKPADAVVHQPGALKQRIRYPPRTTDLQHEVELVVGIGQGALENHGLHGGHHNESGVQGLRIPADHAIKCVATVGVGLDMTRRCLQKIAKASGRPWDMAKGFDDSAPISEMMLLEDYVKARNEGVDQQHHKHASELLSHGNISLEVNDTVKQSGNLSEMTLKIPELISLLSSYVELQPGDLIFTGTPEGVNSVNPGDTLVGRIDGLPELVVQVRDLANFAHEEVNGGKKPNQGKSHL